MKHLLTLIALAVSALAQEKDTPKPAEVNKASLTNEERLSVENASLKLENASLKQQVLELQKPTVQQSAQSVFETVCKRAGIEVSACQFDPKTNSVSKVEPPKPEAAKPETTKPEVKK